MLMAAATCSALMRPRSLGRHFGCTPAHRRTACVEAVRAPEGYRGLCCCYHDNSKDLCRNLASAGPLWRHQWGLTCPQAKRTRIEGYAPALVEVYVGCVGAYEFISWLCVHLHAVHRGCCVRGGSCEVVLHVHATVMTSHLSTLMAIWLVIVPEGQNSPASCPNIRAAMACRSFTEGSSAQTSSPTCALIIVASIGGVGLVTVSDRRSMTLAPLSGACICGLVCS